MVRGSGWQCRERSESFGGCRADLADAGTQPSPSRRDTHCSRGARGTVITAPHAAHRAPIRACGRNRARNESPNSWRHGFREPLSDIQRAELPPAEPAYRSGGPTSLQSGDSVIGWRSLDPDPRGLAWIRRLRARSAPRQTPNRRPLGQDGESHHGGWSQPRAVVHVGVGRRVPTRRARGRPVDATGRLRGQAGRDALVFVVDGRPELLHTDDACQRDERDQQRVLDEVLTLIFTRETDKHSQHFDSSSRLFAQSATRLPSGTAVRSAAHRSGRACVATSSRSARRTRRSSARRPPRPRYRRSSRCRRSGIGRR
jgi:hypothetical protein